MIRHIFRRAATAFAMVALVLGQVTWALAGTTGGISGVVTETSGSPIAGASVKIVSASQSANATTDATGRFNFLSLAPDTYSVSIEKEGYQPVSYAGVSVFADNTLTLSFRMEKALKTIAKVSATSAGSLVKAGVGSDIYSVNSQSITTASALGGGGNLNSAYSAISSVPGVTVPAGGMGWNQPTYVRGSQFFFTGFEYDGIPVNRAFDNYNSSTESNLGLQELQVYTGGGPSSSSSSGTAGFINQVFKTGTYPGYLDLSGGVGTPTYYHQAKVEAGGATPDRRFSYYVGISGYNQDFRFLDNNNGGALTSDPTGIYTGQSIVGSALLTAGVPRTMAPECLPGTSTTPASVANLPWVQAAAGGNNCYIPFNGVYGNLTDPAMISDRENVVNFHFRIPQKNGTSDDIQLLGSTSMLNTSFYTSANDLGGYAAYTNALFGNAYCNPSTSVNVNGAACTPTPYVNYPAYVDAQIYNAPFGTPVKNLTPSLYYQPSSPTNRGFQSELPDNLRDAIMNDTGIVKLQYTHQFSSNAFARVFGYTFFSDWTQAGANSSQNCYLNSGFGPCFSGVAANYDLITHTGGGQIELVDQLTSQHLLQLTGNYTTANVVRFNNTGFTNLSSPVGLISQNTSGVFSCYDTTGAGIPCSQAAQSSAADIAANGIPGVPAGSAAALAGAQWSTLWNGNASGSYNTVKPQFGFVSLSDQWRPNDRFLINAQLRYEDYQYGLVSNPGTPTDFYAQIIQNDVCQNASGAILTKPLLPGQPPPAPVIYTPSCAAGTVVPGYANGIPSGYTHPAFSPISPSSYTIQDVSPRLSATYTQSPDTVWRGSVGRFTEPPISASLQYLNISGNNLSVWNATLPLGFNSPFHPIPAMSATQADLSLERHIHGTDMSFKISPFYNYTTGYQEQSFIGPNFVTQAPVGNFRSMGVELAFTKGDFAKDGLSTQLSLTYTNARIQNTNWFGTNQLNAVNQAIGQFNLLTKGGGGSAFYCNNGRDAVGNPSPGSASAAGCAGFAAIDPTKPVLAITNPYYNMNPQGSIDTGGWYPAGDTGLSPTSNPSTTYFDSPWNMSWLLNYRKQKFAATFSMQLVEGSAYGGPLDVTGIDPRACTSNAQASGITLASPGTDPFACDAYTATGTFSNAAGVLYIPNPQTGSFAQPGQYRNPWLMVGNLALTYDISPRISANVTLANLFHTCFGGTTTAWTSAFPPGTNICGYQANAFYVSNFYNGTSPFDTAANGFTPPAFQTQSYSPRSFSDAGSVPTPFNVFFQLTLKV